MLTLLSFDGSFGGPARVALGQAQELDARGHDVTVLAAGRVETETRDAISFETRTYPALRWTRRLGFGGLMSPKLWSAVREATAQTDVFHFHLGRDGVTMPACLLARHARVPYVAQTHGMIMPDARRSVHVADAIATRRALVSAAQVLYLTEVEKEGLRQVAGTSVRLMDLSNGVRVPLGSDPPPRDGVLFCSRLHPRKRVLAFVEMAAVLRRRGCNARFAVVGPDEGDLARLKSAIEVMNLVDVMDYEGSLAPEEVLARIGRSSVFVLPSENEPFPMAVLEAMSVKTPVVITDSCHIAGEIAAAGAAAVCDGSPEGLANAVERILCDPGFATQLTDRASELLTERYSLSRVVDDLEAIYSSARQDT